MRRKAAYALGRIDPEPARVVGVLIATLGDSDEDVRKSAAEALGKIGDARAAEPLIAALKDNDWKVVKGAAVALQSLGWQPSNEVQRAILAIALENWDEVVRLEGFRSDAMRLLAAADLLVVPSQSFESFGLTCVEAMVRQVPVVATRIGGLPEVVVDEDGGYVVAHDDTAALAARMTDLLADPKLRRAQGARMRGGRD